MSATDLHKYIDPLGQRPFHSSVYSRVARGNRIGSTRYQSFAERQRIESDRSAVNRYHDSHVVQNRGEVRSIARSAESTQIGKQTPIHHKTQSSQSRYHEPPTRGYNPYG